MSPAEALASVPMPPNVAVLHRDEAGRPVPFFVAYPDGKPDFRVMDGHKLDLAVAAGLCWMCGRRSTPAKRSSSDRCAPSTRCRRSRHRIPSAPPTPCRCARSCSCPGKRGLGSRRRGPLRVLVVDDTGRRRARPVDGACREPRCGRGRMNVIHKYEIAVGMGVAVPESSRVVHVGMDPWNRPCVWVSVEPHDEPTRDLLVVGTGHEYDAGLWRHVGSLVWPYVELVLHVLDRHLEEVVA